jgi:hypothetical protein
MIEPTPKGERQRSKPRRSASADAASGDRLPGFEAGAGPVDQQLRRALRAAVPEAELVVTQAAREAIHEEMPAPHREALAAALPSAWAEVSALQVWVGAMQQDLADRELRISALYRALSLATPDRATLTERLEQGYAELNRFGEVVQRGITSRQQAVVTVFTRALAPQLIADPEGAIDPSFAKCACGLALLSQAPVLSDAGRDTCRELARRATSLFRFDFIVPSGLGIGEVSRFLANGTVEGARDIGVLVKVIFAQRDADRLARDLLGKIGAL